MKTELTAGREMNQQASDYHLTNGILKGVRPLWPRSAHQFSKILVVAPAPLVAPLVDRAGRNPRFDALEVGMRPQAPATLAPRLLQQHPGIARVNRYTHH